MEHRQQEVPVELVELAIPALAAEPRQPRPQVVAVVVHEALALHEVDEHQAIHQERGVPLAVALDVEATDGFHERVVLLEELLVELVGDLVGVEGRPHPAQQLGHGRGLVKADLDHGEALVESLVGGADHMSVRDQAGLSGALRVASLAASATPGCDRQRRR